MHANIVSSDSSNLLLVNAFVFEKMMIKYDNASSKSGLRAFLVYLRKGCKGRSVLLGY